MMTFSKFATRVIFLSLSGLVSASALADGELREVNPLPQAPILIALDGDYPPFNRITAEGKWQGFEVELANAMCTELKRSCKLVQKEWDELVPSLQAKQVDMVMASMSITPERRQMLAFSEPYFENQLFLVGKKNPAKPAKYKFSPTLSYSSPLLKGKKLGVQRTTMASDYAITHFSKAKIAYFDSYKWAVEAMDKGKVDFVLLDNPNFALWFSTPEATAYEVKGSPISVDDYVAIAFRPHDPLVNEFNHALAHLKINGKYAQIYQKYF